jgi:hypothetical protein
MSLKAKPMPSLDYLNSILEIKDGLLYNKITRNSRAVKGQLAGAVSGKYKLICLHGKPFLAHRITFYMANGNCPDFIDHIDNNGHNNHIDNLRPATRSENQLNRKLAKSNISGVKGVSWSKREKTWYACLNINGINKNLGYFKSLDMAKEFIELAREMAHGKFTNHGVSLCR